MASNTNDKTLRIYEEINGNFTLVQQLPIQDQVAIDTWGTLVFINNNEVYLVNSVQGALISMYMHRFVRLDNGTWEEQPTIDSKYLLDSWGELYNNIVVGVG